MRRKGNGFFAPSFSLSLSPLPPSSRLPCPHSPRALSLNSHAPLCPAPPPRAFSKKTKDNMPLDTAVFSNLFFFPAFLCARLSSCAMLYHRGRLRSHADAANRSRVASAAPCSCAGEHTVSRRPRSPYPTLVCLPLRRGRAGQLRLALPRHSHLGRQGGARHFTFAKAGRKRPAPAPAARSGPCSEAHAAGLPSAFPLPP